MTTKRGRLWWFGHVERKDDADWLKRCMKMEFERTRQRGRPRNTWWDCVKADMESFGLSLEDAQDRDYWRMRIKGEPVNPGLPGKRPLKQCVCVCVCVCVCSESDQLGLLASVAACINYGGRPSTAD